MLNADTEQEAEMHYSATLQQTSRTALTESVEVSE